jgi:cellobiose-specific phosphotransferase system component IIA
MAPSVVGGIMSARDRFVVLLTLIPLAGCLGRGQSDLLQARLRAQQQQLVETQSQLKEASKSLAEARRESEELRTELAQLGSGNATTASGNVVAVSAIKINSMLTAGVNKDGRAGDDAVVINFAPYDDDGEMVKMHGTVDVVALDPRQPEGKQTVAKWTFTPEETRQHWVRGFLGSGYQFTLPWPEPPQHDEYVLHVRLRAPDDREFVATQVVKIQPEVVTAGGTTTTQTVRRPLGPEDVEIVEPPLDRRRAIQESTNWTDTTMPIRR